jgi:hypothetical protein
VCRLSGGWVFNRSPPTVTEVVGVFVLRFHCAAGYISPYTGEIIQLTNLFTTIPNWHIFPQSRFLMIL